MATLLLLTPAVHAFEAKDFYKELISFEQDLGHADMTYLYCNPFKDNEISAASLSANIYADSTARKVPEVLGKELMLNYSEPLYSPAVAKNGTVTRNISGYAEGFRPARENEVIKPGECRKVRQRTTGEPRFGNISGLDVVPVTSLEKVDADEKALEGGGKAAVSMPAWEWWSIIFQNRTWLWVNNSNTHSFSAYPTEVNVTLVEAGSNGQDLRMACDNEEVPFAYKAYGSQVFGLRWHVKLGLNSVNKSCYVYYNPTLGVKNASANWNDMYWNLWFNATEDYWAWSSMLQYTASWYVASAPTGVGGASLMLPSGQYAISTSTSTRPNPTFVDVNVPNRALIRVWSLDNDTSQQSGIIFSESDVTQAPYTSYMITVQRQTAATGRIILRKYSTGGAGTILASNSTSNTFYRGYVRTDIIWTPNNAIYTKTRYLNGTLMQVLNHTDISYGQGAIGFDEESGAYYHAIGYRQFAYNGVRAMAKGNDSALSVIVPTNASAQNLDIDWGAPSMQYCGSGSVWQRWDVDINGDDFIKLKEYPCQYGCWDGKCRASELEEFVMLGLALLGLVAAGAAAAWLVKRM